MNYEKEILKRLLEKYEKSRAFTTGIFSKRIALTVIQESWIQERMERPDEKHLFLNSLNDLKRNGLIDYSWEKYEEGNLVDKIWLIPDVRTIRICYDRLGRTPAKEKADELHEMLEECLQKIDLESPLSHFLKICMEELEKKRRIQRFFTDDRKLNEDILKCLVYMEGNQEEQMERLMSTGLYGDSKYFEKHVKPKVLPILRCIKQEESEDVLEDEDLLREKGIVRWPEILEFTGRLVVCLKDEEVIDYRTQKYGAYINSETVKQISEVRPDRIRRVMFIENKANYIWYVTHEKADNELVIYHGGCYSPLKGKWFQKIYAGCQKQKEKVQYFHWSDIDVGGFRIFRRLQKNIVSELEPYKMDENTLEKYKDDAMEISSESYLRKLSELGQNLEYACFHGVISVMLKYHIRLEQEKIITAILSCY